MTGVAFSVFLGSCREEQRANLPDRQEINFLAGEGAVENWIVPEWIGGGAEIDFRDNELTIAAGSPINGLVIDPDKISLPAGAFEVSAEAMRVDGNDIFFGLTFPVPGKFTFEDKPACMTLVAGGWGDTVTGFSSINGFDAKENPSASSGSTYRNGEWYHFRLRVSSKSLRLWVNDRELISANIENKRVGMRSGEVELCQPFGLITWGTTAKIRNLQLRQLPNK